MTKSILRLLSASAVTLMGLMNSAAEAAPIWVRTDPILNGGLFNAGFGTPIAVSSDSGASFQAFRAGAFTLQSNSGDPVNDPWRAFVTYCFELAQFIRLNNGPVQYDSFALNSPILTPADQLTLVQTNAISRLWSNGFATSLTSGEKSAGFQVAIWDIVLDGAAGLDGLTGGVFRVQELPQNAVNVNVRGFATDFLSVAYDAVDPSLVIGGLFHPTNQNLLFPPGQEGPGGTENDPTVPAPATLLLLGAGLAALASQRRRPART